MSLLLNLRTTVQGGTGTILLVRMALGVPVAAQSPAWLNAPDELAPVAQESEWLPPPPQAVAPFRWVAPTDDDFIAAAALEDAGYLPSVQQPSYRLTLLHGTAAVSTPLGTPSTDDLAPYVLYVTPQPRLPLWLGATDETVPPPALALDDGAWVLPTVAPVVPLAAWPIWLGADDRAAPVTTMVEDEPYLPLVRQPSITLRLLSGGQAPTSITVVGVPEDVSYLPWVRQPSYQLSLLVGGGVPGAYQPVGNPTDEWHYQQFLPPPAPVVLFGPWSYGVAEDIATFGIIEDQWLPWVRAPQYRVQVLASNMARSAPLILALPDEDYHHVLWLPAPQPVVLFGPWSFGVSEDTVPLLQGDEGLWLPPLVRPATWAGLVVVAPDELPSLLVQEEAWQPPLIRVAQTARLILTLPDDVAQAVPLGVQEDYALASFLRIQYVIQARAQQLPVWLADQREQAFGLVVPDPNAGRGQVIPAYLWRAGPHLRPGGFGRG